MSCVLGAAVTEYCNDSKTFHLLNEPNIWVDTFWHYNHKNIKSERPKALIATFFDNRQLTHYLNTSQTHQKAL